MIFKPLFLEIVAVSRSRNIGVIGLGRLLLLEKVWLFYRAPKSQISNDDQHH